MRLQKQPETERECWLAIEALGSIAWSDQCDIIGLYQDQESQRMIREAQRLINQLISEVCEKFNVVRPPVRTIEEINAFCREGRQYPPPPPEGKEWYPDWFSRLQKEVYRERYDDMICSACPFSEGFESFLRLGGVVPCTQWPGMLYRLDEPHLCGMVSHGKWDQTTLHRRISRNAGAQSLRAFRAKEQELLAKAPVPV